MWACCNNSFFLKIQKASKHERIRYTCDQCGFPSTKASYLMRHKLSKRWGERGMKSAQRREIKTYKKKEGKKEENLKKDKKKEVKIYTKNFACGTHLKFLKGERIELNIFKGGKNILVRINSLGSLFSTWLFFFDVAFFF